MIKEINVSQIKLSLILIILICAIIFFLYLRKERFHNIQDMLNMKPNDMREKLTDIKKCIKNPKLCNQQKRNQIVTQLDALINLTRII